MFTIEVTPTITRGRDRIGMLTQTRVTLKSRVMVTRGERDLSRSSRIEDLEPHQIQVDILPDRLKIYLDGALVVDHDESLIFKGAISSSPAQPVLQPIITGLIGGNPANVFRAESETIVEYIEIQRVLTLPQKRRRHVGNFNNQSIPTGAFI